MSGGGSATQALLSGQIHFSSSAGSALSAALRGGPVKIIYTNQSRPTYKLLSNKPEIKTLQDLIGKKIAINTFGDTGHLATLLLLKKYRLDPKAFLFIAVRSEARFPAFLSGAIDAAPLSPRDIAQIGAMRVNTLADVSKEIQLVWNGVAVSNRLLADNPCTGRALSPRIGQGAGICAPLQRADNRHGREAYAVAAGCSAWSTTIRRWPA